MLSGVVAVVSAVALGAELGATTSVFAYDDRMAAYLRATERGDLADLADAALGADTGGILEGPACGAEQLSYRAMVHRAAACCRRRVRCPEWPPRLLAAAAALAGRLLGSSGINAQMVYRQAEDLVFDDHVFRSRLGYRPRPFRPTRGDFSIPRELLRYRLPG